MADQRLDVLPMGPTVRFTVPISPGTVKVRLSSNPDTRRRIALRVVTNNVRCKLGDKDVSIGNTITGTSMTDGSLGNLVPPSLRWALDVQGPSSQYAIFIRDAADNATAAVELTLPETDTGDLPAAV